MPIDIARLQAENAKSIEAVDNSIERLQAMADEGLPFSEAAAVNAELARAQGDKIHLQTVRGHLTAAGVIVSEMDPSVQNRLDELSARLDDAIRQDFKISATLDMIQVTLNAAQEISNVISSHS